MTESKGKKKAAAPRRRTPKASAAFGRLNQLSASGALSKINSEGAPPAAQSPVADAEVPPERDESPAVGTVTEAAPASEPAAQSTPVRASSGTIVHDASALVSEQGHSEAAGHRGSPAEASPIPLQGPDRAPQRLRTRDVGAAHEEPKAQSRSPLDSAQGPPAAAAEVAVRRATGPAFPASSGYSESRMVGALPPQLEEKVQGLPVAYYELAKSYRQAQATRTGRKPAKRNIRLHDEVATSVNRQMVSDKRMLGLRNLKPSQYVDAAITLARDVPVGDLIEAADNFRDQHLGEEAGSASPNHYSISKTNDEWLDDMMDELLLANTTGLHGHMINVIVQSFLGQLQAEAPAPS